MPCVPYESRTMPTDVRLMQRISDVCPSTRSGPRPWRSIWFATRSCELPRSAVALSGRLISQSRSCVSTVPVALAMELGSAVPETGTVVAILTVASATFVPAGW
jgi:hypothetical protein